MPPRSRPSATPGSARRSVAGPREPPNSTATAAVAPSQALPAYQTPTAALNTGAQAALERLARPADSTNRLAQAQATAVQQLTDAATAVNERVASHQAFAEKQRAKVRALESRAAPSSQGQEGGDDDAAAAGPQQLLEKHRAMLEQRESDFSDMSRRAADVTALAEARVRTVIDSMARARDRESVLAEVSGNVVRGDGRVAPTQSTLGASQFRTRTGLMDVDEDAVGDDGQDASGTAGPGVLPSITDKVADRDAQYDELSMRDKYAEHNAYKGFKGSVHDALHQDDGVPLPHANTWFAEEGAAGTPANAGASTQGQEDDEDSDIEVARELISTKCPITLLELSDPLTSPCNHNFEAAAILEMIGRSDMRADQVPVQRGRRTIMTGGRKIIRCPMGSCAHTFGETELRRDVVVRRKIARLQARASQRDAEDVDGDASMLYGAVSVAEDSDGENAGARRETSQALRVKSEMRSSMAPGRYSAVSSTPGLDDSRGDGDSEMDYDDEEDEDDE